MPRVSNSDRQLVEALRNLHHAWAESGDGWRDRTREQFGREYLEEYDARVKSAINSVMELNTLLRQAIKDCS